MVRKWFLAGMCLALGVMGMSAAVPENAVAPLQKAMALSKEKNYAEAISIVNAVLQVTPPDQSKEVHLTLGLLYYKSAQYETALAEFDWILAIDATNPMAYYYLGHIYEQMALRETNAVRIKEKTRQALDSWTRFVDYSKDREVPLMHKKVKPEELRRRASKHIRLLKEVLIDEK